MTRPLPYWRRVGVGRWVCPTTDLALEYDSVNCHLLVFSRGRAVFQCLTLEEATEALHDLLDSREWEGGL